MRVLAAGLLAATLCVSGAAGGQTPPLQETPDTIVRDELLPYLRENPQALLLFAAEMNISNGPASTRDKGERYMFGKLVTAEWVMGNLDSLEADRDKIYAEVERLLLGPWVNGGRTAFEFAERKDARALSYETGKWGKRQARAETIRIAHTTELSNRRRVVHIDRETLEIVR